MGTAALLAPLWAYAGPATDRAAELYAAELYEEAIVVLQQAPRSPAADRLLGLTYYHMLEFPQAQPLLERALGHYPNHRELRLALADVLFARDEPEAALSQLNGLEATAESELLRGRVLARIGRYSMAETALARAAEDPVTAAAAGRELTLLYQEAGRYEQAYRVAERVQREAPDSFEALELAQMLRNLDRAARPFAFAVGYRIESDSNVVLDPEEGDVVLPVSERRDLRHVFTADLTAHRRLAGDWSIQGEAHLYHGAHRDLHDYDQSRQAYAASLNWDRGRYGARLPLELVWNYVDGSLYRSSGGLAPGLYARVGRSGVVYGYLQYVDAKFRDEVLQAEDRSGIYRGAGVTLLWPFAGDRTELQAYLRGGEDATEGDNWARSELGWGATLLYRATPAWEFSLGYGHDRHDYDNLNDVFLQHREDSADTWHAGAAYGVDDHWRLNLQATYVDWGSNLAVYDYDRSVVALGVSWER